MKTVVAGPVTHTAFGRGARLALLADAGGWSAPYYLDTHGLTFDEVDAKLAAIDAQHSAKAAHLTAMGSIRGAEIVSGGTYRIVDCTLWDQGTDVEVFVDVRLVADSGTLEPLGREFFPLRIVVPSMGDVPSPAVIRQLVEQRISDHSERSTEDAAHHAALRDRFETVTVGAEP